MAVVGFELDEPRNGDGCLKAFSEADWRGLFWNEFVGVEI